MVTTTITTEAEDRADLERRSAEYRAKFLAHRKDDGFAHPDTLRYARLWHLAERELEALPNLDEEGYER